MDNPSTVERESHPVTKSATEARQGETRGIVRWVLAISLFGTIVGMLIGYWFVVGS